MPSLFMAVAIVTCIDGNVVAASHPASVAGNGDRTCIDANMMPEMMPVVLPSPKLLTVAVPVAWMAVPLELIVPPGVKCVTIGHRDVCGRVSVAAVSVDGESLSEYLADARAVDFVGHGSTAGGVDGGAAVAHC